MPERTMPAPGRERDRMLGEALGYSLSIYDSDYRENCYWALLDPEGNRVLMGDGWREGERASADEAWADLPQWSTSDPASLDVLAAMEARGYVWVIDHCQPGRYFCRMGTLYEGEPNGDAQEAEAGTLADAITQAAIMAVWAEQEDGNG